MFRSLFSRRLVTGVSVVMLLLCQTAAAALACAAPPSPKPAVAVEVELAACHTTAQNAEHNLPVNGCQERCPSRDASLETAKINLPAAASLAPAIFTAELQNPPWLVATVPARYEQLLACAAPPPLRLLYCRLLN